MPCKHGVALQIQVFHHVTIGIDFVFTESAHLLLQRLQIFLHRGFVGKLRIHGNRLHVHTHRTVQPLVGTTVIDGVEKRLLVVVVLGKQIGIGCREEGALEDVMRGAEILHTLRTDRQLTTRTPFLACVSLAVGSHLRKRFRTVEISGKPLLGLLESRCIPGLCLAVGHIHHAQAVVTFPRLPIPVGEVDVVQHQTHRRTINDDVMIVDKQIETDVVTEQADAEQAVATDIERLHQALFLPFKVIRFFHRQAPRLVRHVDGLRRLPAFVQHYARKQGRVTLDGRLDGATQALTVQTSVQLINIRQIIAYLACMTGTLHIDAILCFRKRCRLFHYSNSKRLINPVNLKTFLMSSFRLRITTLLPPALAPFRIPIRMRRPLEAMYSSPEQSMMTSRPSPLYRGCNTFSTSVAATVSSSPSRVTRYLSVSSSNFTFIITIF